MVVEASTQQDRVAGRVWTVRLDPHGRASASEVRLSCSGPACADERFPSTAVGRKAAVAHVNMHLARIRTGGGPRGDAWCGCRAADCAWHTSDPDAVAGRRGGPRPGAVRCGGPVTLSVYADRTGRLWRIAETCARCAAATTGCRVLDTAPPPAPRPAPADPSAAGREPTGGSAAATFSDQASSSPVSAPADSSDEDAAAPAAESATVPAARAASSGRAPGRAKPLGKIAQRTVPPDLGPEALRVELIELGDAFRAYQKRTEPDLLLLAELHERKARAFALWADVTADTSLRLEAERAEKAARSSREMYENRFGVTSGDGDDDGPSTVERLLTRSQAAHARTVLRYVGAHAPHAEADVHLAVFLLALRAARAGTGNVTGQDLSGWLRDDAERVLEQLIAADWLLLPCTAAEALAARPENPTPFTVPELLPEGSRPFTLGKATRSRVSGWAQKVVSDRKLRKKKADAATRLLALYTAAQIRPDGRLGSADDGGLDLAGAAAFCALPPDEVAARAELLVAADWLAEADTAGGLLRGRISERILPLGGLL
ncbi:hypothetical protein [Streptomyces sp. NPDC050504]|uniref:hypothetical protein n=1 Tax=Streptomyces sp. NPDC050504 TaxID=3365618 RepID=UPI0037B66210